MSKPSPLPPRNLSRWVTTMLGLVYQTLADNELQERWIADKGGIFGLQEEDRITVSRNTLAPIILHECIHALFPKRRERDVERTTRALWSRMSDTDAKALVDTWDKLAKRIKRPTTAD